jgi:hypothetical protein
MELAAASSPGRWIGLALLGTAFVGEGLVAYAAWRVGPGPLAAVFLLIALAGLPALARLAYWVWGSINLRYRLGRDGIAIQWAGATHVVPMAAITHVLDGRPYDEKLRGLHWPGHEVGHTSIATDDGRVRPALVYATAAPDRQLLIVTEDLAYAISPTSRAQFLAEFRMRQRLGTVQQLDHETVEAAWLGLALWRDPLAFRLLAAALLLAVLSLAWLVWHYPGLPRQVDVSVRVLAPPGLVPEATRARGQLWSLPLLGMAAVAVNWLLAAIVHERAQLAATLLAAGALLVALSLWVVMIGLIA